MSFLLLLQKTEKWTQSHLKLKNELTLTFFSPVAVKMIAEAMQNAGYDRSNEQVKNALINLRTMYIDFKIGMDNNENPEECMFYTCLDTFWGREYKKCRLRDKQKKIIRSDDTWSLQETIMLLNSIKDLNIAEEAFETTERAAHELKRGLADNGYTRSMMQVINRLSELKKDFVKVYTMYDGAEAVKRFPYYMLYKRLFHRQITVDEIINQTKILNDMRPKDGLDFEEFCEKLSEPSQTNEGLLNDFFYGLFENEESSENWVL